MKSKIITLLIFCISLSAIAQSGTDTANFRPTKGNFAFELDFLPFSESGPIDLKSFRGKYFFTNQIALRAGFNFDHSKKTDELPKVYNIDGNDIMKFDKYDMKSTMWGIDAGIEYHFFKHSRVSPYVGFDIGFETKSAAYNDEINKYDYYSGGSFEVVKTEVENAWGMGEMAYDQWGNFQYVFTISERAYTSFKANIVAGADIYILRYFYAGVELGLGMNNVKYKEVTVKEDGVITLKYPEKKDNTFGLNFNNAIRIGFWF